MDKISPAVADTVEESGWGKARSPVTENSAILPEQTGGTLSSAISAATVTLLDEDHVNSTSPIILVNDSLAGEVHLANNMDEDFEECDEIEPQSKKMKTGISVSLEGQDLWQQFYHANTEMIITKTGR